MEKINLLAVDGNNIAHRAFHAFNGRNLTNSDGNDISAVYGLISTLTKAIKYMESINLPPTHMIVAFDPRTCWRNDEYSEYKAGRGETDERLREQLNNFVETLTGIGVPAVLVDGFEADDVLASAAKKVSDLGGGTAILSGDRDLLQMVGEKTLVLAPQNGGTFKVMNRAAVVEKYNVEADRYLDFAALRGDKSDNLPGIIGVGPVKAEKLLAEYGGALEALEASKETPEAVDAIAGGGTSKKMIATASNLERNMRLMKLSCDVELNIEDFKPQAELTTDGMAKLELVRLAEPIAEALATMTVRRVFQPKAA